MQPYIARFNRTALKRLEEIALLKVTRRLGERLVF